jgi:haloalkane dehalogenase
MPERFDRLIILNTWLHHKEFVYTEGMLRWREFATGFAPGTGDMPTGNIVSSYPRLSEEDRPIIKAAYDAPFPDASFKAGPRRFPWCIPFAQPVEGNAADQERCFQTLKNWDKPAHFIFGDADRVFTPEWGQTWAAQLAGPTTFDIVPGPHHVMEQSGPLITEIMLKRIGEEKR